MLIITNFKGYPSAIGAGAIELAKIHQEVARETGASFGVAPQIVDLTAVVQALTPLNPPLSGGRKVEVYAQHLDDAQLGSCTGANLAEAIKAAGATGTILNHSEKRFPDFQSLKAAADRAKSVGLQVIICAETPEEGAQIMQEMNPDFVAVEPPDLIGGDVSVCTRPDVITRSVQLIGADRVIVGAGVKTGDDVQKAQELGAVGILLASGVIKSNNPYNTLVNLASSC